MRYLLPLFLLLAVGCSRKTSDVTTTDASTTTAPAPANPAEETATRPVDIDDNRAEIRSEKLERTDTQYLELSNERDTATLAAINEYKRKRAAAQAARRGTDTDTATEPNAQATQPERTPNAGLTPGDLRSPTTIGDDTVRQAGGADVSSAPAVFRFTKGPCYGSCPQYSITVLEDGTMLYTGKKNVGRLGDYSASPRSFELDRLMATYEKLTAERLADTYPEPSLITTDAQATTLSFTEEDGTVRNVRFFSDAPAAFLNLERQLDALLKTLYWEKQVAD